MEKVYEKPYLKEEKVEIDDVIATSVFGNNEPGDVMLDWGFDQIWRD